MATMNDVATKAGVSVATVSNYLNGTKSVKPETKRRIKEAIEQLNFHPSAFARNLKTNNSSEIGIVVPNVHNSYYSYILQGIEPRGRFDPLQRPNDHGDDEQVSLY